MSSNLSWDKLFLNGSVVSLSTGLWRARVQIKPEDIGIEDTDAVKTALSLGCHRLAPPKAFEDILRPAREAARMIDYFSVNFGLIRGARYVPEKNLPLLVEQLKKNKDQFNSAVDAFMQNYETTKAEMLPIIEQALVDSACAPQAAIDAFNRIKAEYPTAGEVRAKFSMSWSIYAVKSAKNENVADAAAEEAEGVKNIIGDMVKQLRDDMTGKLKQILEITAKGGKLPEKSVRSATEMLDRIDSLNVLNDSVLKDQILAMRKALAGVTEGKYSDDFVTGLNSIQEELEKSVEQAIIEAEQSLTGVGRRKLNLVEQPKAEAVQETMPLAPVAQPDTQETFDLGSL